MVVMRKIFRLPVACVIVAVLFFFYVPVLSAEVRMTVEEALKTVLPQARKIEKKTVILTAEQKARLERQANVTIHPEYNKEFIGYIGKSDSEGPVVGYAFEDTVPGKWGPIHYLLAVDPAGKITNVVVLDFNERRGRPIAKKNFVNQYIGKTIRDKIKLRQDINGITGATISSRAITDGVRKLLYVFEEFYKL